MSSPSRDVNRLVSIETVETSSSPIAMTPTENEGSTATPPGYPIDLTPSLQEQRSPPSVSASLDSPTLALHHGGGVLRQRDGGTGNGGDNSIEIVHVSPNGPYCVICGDRGSGFHYNAYSCEGCKGFFKRTVQMNLTYSCKENGTCIVNKYTRNNCQHCRYQKCLTVGMKREAVRDDRAPGGKNRSKRSHSDTMTEASSVFPIRTLCIADDCDDTLIQALIAAKPTAMPTIEEVYAGPVPENTSQMTVNDLMQYAYAEIKLIIEWARKVPGFCELLIEDQMALLKASFMELNVLRLTFRSMSLEGHVKLTEGVVLQPDHCINIGWGRDLISSTLEFVDKISAVGIDDVEFAILNAVVLTYPDATDVQNIIQIAELQGRILNSLRKYTTRTYADDAKRYCKILLRLPVLRIASAKATEQFLSMSLDGTIKMNDLVLELLS